MLTFLVRPFGRINLLCLLSVLVVGLLCHSVTLAAPSAEIWPHFEAHDVQSTESIDHSAWDKLLSQNVVLQDGKPNAFRYEKFSDAHYSILDDYIEFLENLTISSHNRDEQLAYWINLYNAVTVDQILSSYPLKSIRDLSSGFFKPGPWATKLLTIEGQEVSLDDIEHRILRPIWKDPRLHYAVNCASLGCPDLARRAFTAENASQLMDENAIAFINHPRGVKINGDRLQISSIYDWFSEDFGNNDQEIIDHLRGFANPSLSEKLGKFTTFSTQRYDWSLNDFSRKSVISSKFFTGGS